MLGRELIQFHLDYIAEFDEVEEEKEDIKWCECGEHEAKWELKDEFMKHWDMKLCPNCLEEMKKEYEIEGTEYKVRAL